MVKEMITSRTTFAALATAIAVLTACSGPAPTVEPGADTPAVTSPVAPAPVTPTTAVATTTTAEPAPRDRSAKFGDTVTFEDGTKVKVKSGGFIQAGQYDIGAVEGRIAVIVMSVTAGTKEINASGMSYPRVRVGAAGRAVQSVTSSELRSDSLSTILPGETQTVELGFAIAAADAKNVRVEVDSPDLASPPAIFKGAIS